MLLVCFCANMRKHSRQAHLSVAGKQTLCANSKICQAPVEVDESHSAGESLACRPSLRTAGEKSEYDVTFFMSQYKVPGPDFWRSSVKMHKGTKKLYLHLSELGSNEQV